MAIRQQLETIAPTGTAATAGEPAKASTKAPPPDRNWLPVHIMAVAFGGVLCLLGLFSGKIGVLLLGLVVGGAVIAMGTLPYFRSRTSPQPVPAASNDNPFTMSDKEWKWEGIRQWLDKHSNPPEVFLPSPIRSKHEQLFAMTLHQYFPHHILTDKVIEQFKKGGNAYHPDFTFIAPDIHLHIDIEIDEPYTSRGHHPTHYCQPDGSSPDAVRNAYFLQKGWVVLRFTEQHIALYPEECCKFLARLVFQLSGNDTHWAQWSYAQPQLPLTPQWTKEEAEKMAQENYRAAYH